MDELPLTAADLLQVLARDHTGHERGITAQALSFKTGLAEREIRAHVTALRKEGFPVCAHPATGYFLAADEAELRSTIQFLTDRAVTSLRTAAQLSQQALPDFIGQLKLPT